ncbi:Gfo/Idh/MocA family oxidoreductase [Acidobacteria bacterium AH-259-L09]|nr:Gfo/Idh/MocA family oxidoreductase [Acidobacteria bacterium AH-259-L09]
MSKWSRRNFLKSAGTGIALSSASLFVGTAKSSPNDRVRHAVIGTGGMGQNHCRRFSNLGEDVEVVAICDLDPERREKAAQLLPSSSRLAKYEDYRRILDDKSIDTVSVVTPDHWHTKIALEAILAGKHVYVEKPCSHNVTEGKLLLETANKYEKCVQHGTHSRSGQGIIEAMQFLHEGNLGKVRMAKAINHQLRKPIGTAPPSDPPPGVNYDLWLGPAPKHAFTKHRWHYNWHWFWDYGTGDLGNDGIHQLDVARWGLNVEFPKTISAPGGQLFYNDDHETPDAQMITYVYDDCHLNFEMRLWTDYKFVGHDNGTIFYGDKGTLEVGREGCFVRFIGEEPQKIGGGHDLSANMRNFIDGVKDNNPRKLKAPIREGVISAELCHLGNIATRVGRQLEYHPKKRRFVNDKEANKLLSRDYRKGFELPEVS